MLGGACVGVGGVVCVDYVSPSDQVTCVCSYGGGGGVCCMCRLLCCLLMIKLPVSVAAYYI